jgi:Tfp pilus assembly protein PilE
MRTTAHGFTLIEVVIIVALIVVLAGIALPHYVDARGRAFDTRVAATVRHLATAEEAFFTTRLRYTADPRELEGAVLEDGIKVTIAPGNSGDLATSFRIRGWHPDALNAWQWTSDPGVGEPHLTTG